MRKAHIGYWKDSDAKVFITQFLSDDGSAAIKNTFDCPAHEWSQHTDFVSGEEFEELQNQDTSQARKAEICVKALGEDIFSLITVF